MTLYEHELKNAYIGEYPQLPIDWMLVYYPLISDANDHKSDLWVSWTTYNGTWWGTANYGTVWWKTWALFSRWSNRINTWFSRSSAPITICAFVYETNPVASDWQTPIGNPSWNNQNWYAIRLVWVNNSVRFNNWTWSDKIVSNMSSNEWHCLILTIKSWESKLYIDWVLAYTDSTGGNASWGSFYIASYWTYTTYWFNWYIRNVAIYNRVLSSDEAIAYNDYFK